MKLNKKVAVISAFIFVLLVAGVAFFLNEGRALRVLSLSSRPPVFVFNEEAAPDWWAAKSHNSQETAGDTYEGDTPIDQLAVANMVAFKGVEGDMRTDCFAMFAYYDYKTDLAKLKAEKDSGTLGGYLQTQRVGVTEATITVFDADKAIQMNNYELSGSGSEDSMKGMSYGWIEATDGYIEVSGVCPSAGELDQIADIAAAISLAKQ